MGSGREGTKLDKSYSAVWDNVSLTSEASEWSRARLAIALGAKPNRSGAVQLDLELDPQKPGSPVGTVCLGRVASDKDLDGNYRAKIGFIGPLEVTSEKDEAFSEDDEEEEDSPFEDEEEGEEEEGDLFTREDLENMENKELGQVAKDFEINTRDFVSKVKGKTVPDREGLIAAILEAQGIDEEEDDLSSDDDPF